MNGEEMKGSNDVNFPSAPRVYIITTHSAVKPAKHMPKKH